MLEKKEVCLTLQACAIAPWLPGYCKSATAECVQTLSTVLSLSDKFNLDFGAPVHLQVHSLQ